MIKPSSLLLLLFIPTCLLLFACSSRHHDSRYTQAQDGPPLSQIDVSHIPDAQPKVEALSRYGNPATYRVFGQQYHVMSSAANYHERGVASWYGTKFHGQRTSSGEAYDMLGMTAAHKSLPIPCYVRVTNLENHRQVIVKVNDRGPFRNNRLIDLSYVAAKKLGILARGTGLVEIETIDPRQSTVSQTMELEKPLPKSSVHTKQHTPAIYLQLGAFGLRENAEKLRLQVAHVSHHQAHLTDAESLEKPLYRVQIGPFANVEEADALSEELKQTGFGQAWLVVG